MFAPGVSFMNEEFNNHSSTISAFAVSVFVLGYSVSFSDQQSLTLPTI